MKTQSPLTKCHEEGHQTGVLSQLAQSALSPEQRSEWVTACLKDPALAKQTQLAMRLREPNRELAQQWVELNGAHQAQATSAARSSAAKGLRGAIFALAAACGALVMNFSMQVNDSGNSVGHDTRTAQIVDQSASDHFGLQGSFEGASAGDRFSDGSFE